MNLEFDKNGFVIPDLENVFYFDLEWYLSGGVKLISRSGKPIPEILISNHLRQLGEERFIVVWRPDFDWWGNTYWVRDDGTVENGHELERDIFMIYE